MIAENLHTDKKEEDEVEVEGEEVEKEEVALGRERMNSSPSTTSLQQHLSTSSCLYFSFQFVDSNLFHMPQMLPLHHPPDMDVVPGAGDGSGDVRVDGDLDTQQLAEYSAVDRQGPY